MLFINISSDKIHLADGHKEKILDRNGIENILGPILIDRQKTAPFTEIFLINGPGGFTNLRVGTLMLNTLNMFQKDILDRQKNQGNEVFLDARVIPTTGETVSTNKVKGLQISKAVEYKIQIFEVDKLTLFAHLVKAGLLPPQGIVYLGQKHNVWLGDFSQMPPVMNECKLTTIPAHAFLDEVHDETYRPQGTKNMIKFTNEKGKIYANYQNKRHEITIHDLKLEPVTEVQANYMIQPILN